MVERGEAPSIREVTNLPDDVARKLITTTGREFGYEDLQAGVIRNQERFGRGIDDYAAMVEAHQNVMDRRILGIREEIRKAHTLEEDGKEIKYVEATPKIRNIWVGKHSALLTPDEASTMPYAGKTVLEWATVRGKIPERVAKANNGYFYPATKNDIVIPSDRL